MLPEGVTRLYTSAHFHPPLHRLNVLPNETVAVVLLSRGFPTSESEQEQYYLRAVQTLCPVKKWLPNPLIKAMGKKENHALLAECEGLESMLHSFGALKTDLSRKLGSKLQKNNPQLQFKIYNAQLFSSPDCASVAAEIKADGIDKIVLLPLYPHFSETNSGSLLQAWQKATAGMGFSEIFVPEYANHPKLIAALSDRIGEALQRFSKSEKESIGIIYTACSVREKDAYKSLFQQLVQQTVSHLQAKRPQYPYQITYLKPVLFGKYFLRPWTTEALATLKKQGHSSVLVIPISYLFDHFDTSYMLEVKRRQVAETEGIRHYEVMNGLNSHPLLIEALAEIVRAQFALRDEVEAESEWDVVEEKLWIRNWQGHSTLV